MTILGKKPTPINPRVSKRIPKIAPRGDRVLVHVPPVARVTESGLHVPETAEKKAQRGKIISVGPGKRTPEGIRIPILDLKPGMNVVFGKYAGAEIDNEYGTPSEYRLISETDVIGICQ